MKKILHLVLSTLFLIPFIPTLSLAQTVTATADLKDVFGNAQTDGQICFTLRNFAGNVPKIAATGVPVNYSTVCSPGDPSTAHVSTTVYANDQISPANTYYTVEYQSQGQTQFRANYRFLLADVTEDLNTKAPLASALTPNPPATDSTYARLDGGNQPFIAPITANGITSKVSVNVKGPNPWYDMCQNGFACDGITDDKPAFNSLVTTACASGGGTLWIPPAKIVRFASAPNHIPCGLNIVGAYSKGSAFGFGSFIKCDYTEAAATNGCLWWDGANAATQGNGGGVIGINIQKGDGKTGGAAVKISGTDCTARAGNVRIDGVKISSSTGTWNYGVYVDGTTCTTLGGQGSRDNFIFDANLFSATTKAVSLNGCSHCYIEGLEASIGAGSNADVDITGTAVANASSTDVLIVASAMTNLNFDWATNSACVGCNVTGNVTSTINTPLTNSFFGNAGGFAGLTRGLSACSPDQTAAASQNVTLCQASRAATFMGAGSNIPSNILTGDVFANQDFVLTKSTDVSLGQSAVRFRRNNGSGTNTNVAILGTDGNVHWNLDPVNGFSSDLTGAWPSLGLKNGFTATFTPSSLAANRAIGMNDPLASATLPLYLSVSDNTVDLASVASGACTAERTVAVTGARFGDNVQIAAGTALEGGGFLMGKVTASDAIKWQFCNLSGGAIDRASDNYTIRVTK